MKYLNLTKDFNPYNKHNYGTLDYEFFTFKGGEPHIKITPFNETEEVTITIRIESFNDIGKLSVAVDALRGLGVDDINLFLPYFPGARQDRLMVDGEPFTSAIYVKLLDNLGFKTITSYDLHSDVVGGMFGVLNTKFIQISNHKFVLEVLRDLYPQHNAKLPILISPDAGSNKKIDKLAKYLSTYNKVDIVKCDKTRDVKTGEITNFEVYADDLNNRDCLIVDDICDGGGTFLGLVKKLHDKRAGNVYLVVSHGIFSKGLKTLAANFNGIYTTDSFDGSTYYNNNVPNEFKVIKLNKVI